MHEHGRTQRDHCRATAAQVTSPDLLGLLRESYACRRRLGRTVRQEDADHYQANRYRCAEIAGGVAVPTLLLHSLRGTDPQVKRELVMAFRKLNQNLVVRAFAAV